MNAMTRAAELTGLILLVLAFVVANVRRPAWHPGRRQLRRRSPALRLINGSPGAAGGQDDGPGRPPDPSRLPASVEDRISRPAALQLEEAVGLGDKQHAIPQPRGILAARDR